MEYEINMSIPVGSRLTFVLFLLTDFIYDPSEPDWAWQGVSLWLPGTNKHFTKTQNKRFCWYIWPVLFFLGMMSSVSASVSTVATVKVTFQYTSCTCACSKYCSVHTVTSCLVYCSIVSSKCAQEKFHKCNISTTQCVSAGGWVVQLEGQQFDTTRSFTIEILKTDQSRADFSLWWKKEQDYCCCCFSNSQSQKFPPRKLIRFFFLFFCCCRMSLTIYYLAHDEQISQDAYKFINCGANSTAPHQTRLAAQWWTDTGGNAESRFSLSHIYPIFRSLIQLKKESHWDPEVKTKQKPKPDSWLVSCLSVVLMCSLNSL